MGWENPLEKEMATHFSILACEIPWTEEPGGLHFMGSQIRHDLATNEQQQHVLREQVRRGREEPFRILKENSSQPHLQGQRNMMDGFLLHSTHTPSTAWPPQLRCQVSLRTKKKCAGGFRKERSKQETACGSNLIYD